MLTPVVIKEEGIEGFNFLLWLAMSLISMSDDLSIESSISDGLPSVLTKKMVISENNHAYTINNIT